MPLTVAVQMDPIERIRIAGDSTFALLLEAQARDHRLLHYTPDRLRLNGKRVEAMTEPHRPFDRRRRASPAGPTVRSRLYRNDAHSRVHSAGDSGRQRPERRAQR